MILLKDRIFPYILFIYILSLNPVTKGCKLGFLKVSNSNLQDEEEKDRKEERNNTHTPTPLEISFHKPFMTEFVSKKWYWNLYASM